MRKILFLALAAVFLLGNGKAEAQKSVSLASLLNEMIDRDQLARFPDPAFTCKQFSSYDRESVAKDSAGWFANADSNQFLRMEENGGRQEFVMMESDGPGAVVRFWMTFAGENRGNGILRFYIDGNPEPVIEDTAFRVLSGGGVVEAPLATSVSELTGYDSRGHDFYLPVPYARSCKVTYEPKGIVTYEGKKYPKEEIVYYNINYRTYQTGTRVVSYTPAELTKNKALIDKVQNQLATLYRSSEKMNLGRSDLSAALQPMESKSVAIQGGKAIRELHLALQSDDMEQALRSTVLEIAFDGETKVWVPAGDFFCIGYKPLESATWYTRTTQEGEMSAYWVMPFRKDCRITIHNFAQKPVTAKGEVRYGSWKWTPNTMYFGSDWHQYTKIRTRTEEVKKGRTGDPKDINFTTLEGKGVYVGDAIALFNTANAWWGEGDEKVYVDGEAFPSHFGTGTEDYYGYAWCSPSVFTGHPFIAQPMGKGSFEAAYSANTRVRALDGIPFTKSLTFDMELWHWADCVINYAPTTFYYMLPGGRTLIGKDLPGVIEKVATRKRDIFRGNKVLSFESENMTLVSNEKGIMQYQFDDRWSNNTQIFWRELETGAKFTSLFRTGYADTFDATCIFTVAPDYGTVNFYINGKLVGKEIDLYNEQVATRSIDLGEVDLKRGENTITVELVKQPKGYTKSVFGFDRILFKE